MFFFGLTISTLTVLLLCTKLADVAYTQYGATLHFLKVHSTDCKYNGQFVKESYNIYFVDITEHLRLTVLKI